MARGWQEDGKSLRRSFDTATGQSALHLVSAWACQSRLSLGQRRVEDKSNEITAIPELLALLSVRGCLVTIDAMGCQREIAQQIHQHGGDYVLALKENQRCLFEAAEQFFAQALQNQWQWDSGVFARPIAYQSCQSVEKGHGRIEVRRCFVVAAGRWPDPEQQWPTLASVACIESERRVKGKAGIKTTLERRYFVSSLPLRGAQGRVARQILRAVRSHWGIENRLHWILDVVFAEDDSRVRTGHAVINLAAALRRFSVSLLQQERQSKMRLLGKRQTAGWDNAYLLQVIASAQVPKATQDTTQETSQDTTQT
jgi:predicted transposase YbfD/YdcC